MLTEHLGSLQNEEIPAQSLETLEEAVKYLLAANPQVAQSVPLLVVKLVQAQLAWQQPLLRSLAFCTSFHLLQAAAISRCDANLAAVIEPTLAAVPAPASTASEAARFALEVCIPRISMTCDSSGMQPVPSVLLIVC